MVFLRNTEEVDYRETERNLKLWLKGQGLAIMECLEWNRWCYNERPFWSVWGTVYNDRNVIRVGYFCGIQIYDDGEVIIVPNSIYSPSEAE